MRAALLSNWNQPATTEMEKPAPTSGEAMIRVMYGGVCGSDIAVCRGQHPTAKTPGALCHEIPAGNLAKIILRCTS